MYADLQCCITWSISIIRSEPLPFWPDPDHSVGNASFLAGSGSKYSFMHKKIINTWQYLFFLYSKSYCLNHNSAIHLSKSWMISIWIKKIQLSSLYWNRMGIFIFYDTDPKIWTTYALWQEFKLFFSSSKNRHESYSLFAHHVYRTHVAACFVILSNWYLVTR